MRPARKPTGVTHYAIVDLLVEGDLSVSGNFDWNGVIIVTGAISFSGGGGSGKNIKGAVLSNGISDISGNVDIDYDSCNVLSTTAQSSGSILSWKRVH